VAVLVGALAGGGAVVTALGSVLTLGGMLACGPLVAGPVAGLLGAPLPRLGGIAGHLARDNATRSPRRTAATAAALMVGVAVVSLFTVFAGSLKSSIQDSTGRGFGGELAIATPGFGGGALNPRLGERVAALSEIGEAVGLGQGAARIAGSSEQLTIADPDALARVADLDVSAGSLGGLGDRELAVSRSFAEDNGWRVGSRVPLTFADETRDAFTVGAIYDNEQLTGSVLMSRGAWAPHASQDLDTVVFLSVADGVGVQVARDAVQRAARADGSPDVQTRAEFVAASAGGIDALLGIVYVLLLLAIVVALMGIANTLSLSIHERTRELGLLRAVGASRRQLRSMIRGESLVIAVFGTLGGLSLGVFLGWGLVRATADDAALSAFSAPVGQLAVVLIAGAVAGMLASLRPARRAARPDVLDAIASQ
ncbi:MAG: ABC transporter permease, partial [Solirubrobacteraceae bacterium]|nr:ABC transporter permease [Solirubrobacteraceae bacterium]